jgi:predicted Zn finger-like uncharacterized protein
MKTETQCPNCSSRFKVAEQNVGRKGRCPSCQTVFEVNAVQAAPPSRQKKPVHGNAEATPRIGVDQEQSSTTSTLGSRKLVTVGVAVIAAGICLTVLAGSMFKPSKREPVQIASGSNSRELPTIESPAAESSLSEPLTTTPSAATVEPIAPTEVVRENQKTTQIVFPSRRKFSHPFEIKKMDIDDGLMTFVRLSDEMDLVSVTAMFDVTDPLRSGKDLKLKDWMQFRFTCGSEHWDALHAKQAVVSINQKRYTVAFERQDLSLYVSINLIDFQRMLSAQRIEFRFDKVRVELTEIQIEAMCDLASRTPDGTTANGSNIVRHESDGAVLSQNLKSKPMPEALSAIQHRRKNEIEDHLQKIASAKSEMKRAKIADDANGISKSAKMTSDLQAELRRLIEAPLDVSDLNPLDFNSGQVGRLPAYQMIVAQVTDRKNGEAMVDYLHLNTKRVFKLAGIDVSNLVDESKFYLNKQNCFHIVGTETYKTVTGRTNTIFRLEQCSNDPQFPETELKLFRDAADPNFKIELTADEEAKAKEVRDAKAQANLDKEKLAKSRRSKSNLDSAKLLLKKDERVAARKFLEKSVAEDPDSESGKEATKLLEDLP